MIFLFHLERKKASPYQKGLFSIKNLILDWTLQVFMHIFNTFFYWYKIIYWDDKHFFLDFLNALWNSEFKFNLLKLLILTPLKSQKYKTTTTKKTPVQKSVWITKKLDHWHQITYFHTLKLSIWCYRMKKGNNKECKFKG